MIEASIILKAIEGDNRAFRTIFDYYLPRMRPTCTRYCDDHELDDILQEAFVKVFFNLKTFKFEGSFEGWIRTIVINTALYRLKKNSKKISLLDIDNISETKLPEITPRSIDFLEQDQLLKLLEQLPEGYKIVFSLYVLEDFSHKEIGEMLGITEGTSRSQYSKARKMLIRLLSDMQENKSSLLGALVNK